MKERAKTTSKSKRKLFTLELDGQIAHHVERMARQHKVSRGQALRLIILDHYVNEIRKEV